MSKPKNMTPEREAEWKAKQRQRVRKWKAKNPEKVRAQNRKDVKAWNLRNPGKAAEYISDWLKTDEGRAFQRRKGKKASVKGRETLSPNYVATLLGIPVAILHQHPELLAAKREHLQAVRTLRNTKQNAPEPN